MGAGLRRRGGSAHLGRPHGGIISPPVGVPRSPDHITRAGTRRRRTLTTLFSPKGFPGAIAPPASNSFLATYGTLSLTGYVPTFRQFVFLFAPVGVIALQGAVPSIVSTTSSYSYRIIGNKTTKAGSRRRRTTTQLLPTRGVVSAAGVLLAPLGVLTIAAQTPSFSYLSWLKVQAVRTVSQAVERARASNRLSYPHTLLGGVFGRNTWMPNPISVNWVRGTELKRKQVVRRKVVIKPVTQFGPNIFSVPFASLSLSGFPVAFQTVTGVSVPAASLSMVGFEPSFDQPVSITSALGWIHLFGAPPMFLQDMAMAVPLGIVTLYAPTPSFSFIGAPPEPGVVVEPKTTSVLGGYDSVGQRTNVYAWREDKSSRITAKTESENADLLKIEEQDTIDIAFILGQFIETE